MRIHLIDGTFELYRAHFSPRPGHTGPGGQDLKATVGLATSLLQLLHEEAEKVTHVAIAFDNPIRSFRNDLFEPYKSDEGVPPELRAQFDLAELAARAVGVRVWSMSEFEADDAIGSAAKKYREADEVRILSPDKDFGQCLDGERVALVDRIRKKETREAAYVADKGFKPRSLPDFLALTGDTADGIPGIPGFGEKTASALLGVYESLEKIPEDASLWPKTVRGASRLSATLNERRADAVLYRTLATLRDDAPIDDDVSGIAFGGVKRSDLEALSNTLGAPKLLERVTRWA